VKSQPGQWNFDQENRSAYKGEIPMPPPPRFNRDDIDQQVLTLVNEEFSAHPGST